MKRASLFVLSLLSTAAVWAGHMCGPMGGGMAHGGMCGMGAGGGFKAPVFIALLALGYWVLRLAEGEKTRLLKVVGRIVAVIILLGSLGGLLCGSCGKWRRGGYGMMTKSAGMCPYSGGAASTDTAAPEAPQQETPKKK